MAYVCMEYLAKGIEVVYKDALDSINKIPFSREKSYKIKYKEIILPIGYNALCSI